jgi:hypothetical protein
MAMDCRAACRLDWIRRKTKTVYPVAYADGRMGRRMLNARWEQFDIGAGSAR